MSVDVHQIKDRVAEKAELVHRLQSELAKAIVGQHEMIGRLLVGLLTDGHILLEGVPGADRCPVDRAVAQWCLERKAPAATEGHGGIMLSP